MASASLLDLPPEIRLLIWHNLGVQETTYHVQICPHGICNVSADVLNILQVNKQIQEDILKVLNIDKLQINVPQDLPSTTVWGLPDFVKVRQAEIRTVIIAAGVGPEVIDDPAVLYWPRANVLDRIRELLFRLPKLEYLQIDQDFCVRNRSAWIDIQEGHQWTVGDTFQPDIREYIPIFERRTKAISIRLGLPLYGFNRLSYTVQINDTSNMKKLRLRITFGNKEAPIAEKASAAH